MTTKPTERDLIEEAEVLLAKATPRPWIVVDKGEYDPKLARDLLRRLVAEVKRLRGEADNCEVLELFNARLTTGLVNIYHVIRGKACPHGVALGMATSAVSSLKSENATLREQLAEVTKERNDWKQRAEEAEADLRETV